MSTNNIQFLNIEKYHGPGLLRQPMETQDRKHSSWSRRLLTFIKSTQNQSIATKVKSKHEKNQPHLLLHERITHPLGQRLGKLLKAR